MEEKSHKKTKQSRNEKEEKSDYYNIKKNIKGRIKI